MKKYRKGIFVVIYRKTPKGIRYLILKRKLHWSGWEFPKGGLEPNENIIYGIKREIKEETGQTASNLQKHDFSGKYEYKKEFPDRNNSIGQTFSLYSAEIKNQDIKIDEKEHSDYQWSEFNDAFKKLTYENQKRSLEIVNNHLKKIAKFRNFILPSGTLMLLGRDAKSNDELVKTYEGKGNILLHTAKPGSPFCVIESLNPSKEDIKLSAIITASKSQDWRNNKSDILISQFTGKEVFKESKMKPGSWKVKKSKQIKVKKQDIEKWQLNPSIS